VRSRAANLRSLLSGTFFVAYGLFALPFAPLLLLPGWSERAIRFVVRQFYRGFVLLARLTRLYRVTLDADTVRALRACRGKVVVMNHVSLIDICILFAFLPDSTAVAKAAARRNPFLGMVVRRVLLATDANAEETLARAKRLLDAGVNIVVFPQGTRGGTTLHRGAARLALACHRPIAVFRIDYDFLPLAKRQPWWDVGEREIMIKLSTRGELQAEGEPSHRAAVSLTERIGELII